MTLDIERERREHIEWMTSDEQSLAKRNDMASLAEAISFNAWLAAKRAVVGSAEPVYFIRPHGHVEKRDGDSPCWLEASEDAYDYTLPANRRICYTAPPAPVSAEPVKFECARMRSIEPMDCEWPTCGCDPHADKVIAALEESGAFASPSTDPKDSIGNTMANVMFNMAQLEGATITKEHCDIMTGLRKRWDAAIAAKEDGK